jgi:predicted phosphodiesterase
MVGDQKHLLKVTAKRTSMRWIISRRHLRRAVYGLAVVVSMVTLFVSGGCARKGLVSEKYPQEDIRIPDLLEDYTLDRDPVFIVYGDNRPGWRVKESFYRKEAWWTWKQFIFPFYQIYWLGNGVVGSVNGIRMKPDYGARQARRVRDAVRIEAQRSHVDFIINTGDIATDGRYPDHWKTFIEQNKEDVPLVLEYPYLPVMGNHEYATDTLYGMPNYRAVFEQEPFYVVECPNVDLIVVDSNIMVDHWRVIDDDTQDALFEKWFVSGENSPQPSWLERQLETSKKSFKLVFMHHPPIAFAKHYENWTDPESGRDLVAKRQRLLELFAEHNVQVVFNGHQHNYEHNTLSSIDNNPLETDIHFVVTGGAGSPLQPGVDAEGIAELKHEYEILGLGAVSHRQDVVYNFCLVKTNDDGVTIDVYEVPDKSDTPAILIDQLIINGRAQKQSP